MRGAAKAIRHSSTGPTSQRLVPVFKNGVLSGCLTALFIVGAILVGLFIDGYHMFRVQKGVTNAPRTPLGIRNAQRGLVQPVVH